MTRTGRWEGLSAQDLPSVRGGAGRLKDDGAPPFFPAIRPQRLTLNPVRRRKKSLPPSPLRGRCAIPDPARSAPEGVVILNQKQETTMTLFQHIEELRAELCNCNDGEERRQIEAELKAAEMQKAALDEAFAVWLEDPD
jgi:hypothetical protein